MTTPSRPAPFGKIAMTPQRADAGSKVITPIKLQAAPLGVQRKVSGGPAWSTPTTFAPTPAASSSPDTRAFSLLAIQQAEQDFAERSGRPKAVKSFAEIQAEEREVEVKRKEEAEFKRWWEEEQVRLKGDAGESSSGRGRGRGRGGSRGGDAERGRGQRKVPPQRGRGGAGERRIWGRIRRGRPVC